MQSSHRQGKMPEIFLSSTINNLATSNRALVMHDCKGMMPEVSDKGSQPYRNALGCFEMAGVGLPQRI